MNHTVHNNSPVYLYQIQGMSGGTSNSAPPTPAPAAASTEQRWNSTVPDPEHERRHRPRRGPLPRPPSAPAPPAPAAAPEERRLDSHALLVATGFDRLEERIEALSPAVARGLEPRGGVFAQAPAIADAEQAGLQTHQTPLGDRRRPLTRADAAAAAAASSSSRRRREGGGGPAGAAAAAAAHLGEPESFAAASPPATRSGTATSPARAAPARSVNVKTGGATVPGAAALAVTRIEPWRKNSL
jgi:hypothetical protein